MTITLPLLEELDQVANLFCSLSASVPAAVNEERTKHEKAQCEPVIKKAFCHSNHFQLSSNIVGTSCRYRASHCQGRLACQRSTRCSGMFTFSLFVLLYIQSHLSFLLFSILKLCWEKPASLGTLLESGNRTLDILHNLVHRPPGQSITDPGGLSRSYTTPLGVKQGVTIPRRNLEGIFLYCVTQPATWLSKLDFDRTPLDQDADDPQAMDTCRADSLVVVKERRPR